MATYTERDPRPGRTVEVAQYRSGQPTGELLAVARRRGTDTRIIEVREWSVLLVRTVLDDGEPDWDVVEDGHWLVYIPRVAVLVSLDDEEFRSTYGPENGS